MKATEENIGNVARDFGRAMSEFRITLRALFQARLREHEVNISSELLEVLSQLWQRDGRNQQELADRVMKDKSSMTYLIDNLVKRDLVKRVEDETDKRNKLIFLTEEGLALRQRLMPWVEDIYVQASEGIKASELERALQMIKKMNDNLNR